MTPSGISPIQFITTITGNTPIKKKVPTINKSTRHDTIAKLAVHLRRSLAQAERNARKARRAAKADHLKAANRPACDRKARKLSELDFMVAVMREAEAKAARQRASLRARRRSR